MNPTGLFFFRPSESSAKFLRTKVSNSVYDQVMRGRGGMGQRKRRPSPVGRTPEEANYARANPRCERLVTLMVMGIETTQRCPAAGQVINHLDKRGLGGWNRGMSRLEHVCFLHHEEFHEIGHPHS